jgi:hypothetical protein
VLALKQSVLNNKQGKTKRTDDDEERNMGRINQISQQQKQTMELPVLYYRNEKEMINKNLEWRMTYETNGNVPKITENHFIVGRQRLSLALQRMTQVQSKLRGYSSNRQSIK